eukprot:SAG31_NODE_1177_length_9532_cov_6.655465_1_plen_74_part_10
MNTIDHLLDCSSFVFAARMQACEGRGKVHHLSFWHASSLYFLSIHAAAPRLAPVKQIITLLSQKVTPASGILIA